MVQMNKVTLFLGPLIVLMLWMDVALFVKVQHLPPGHDNDELTIPSGGLHSAFDHLTMKLLMMCPPMHYAEMPLTGAFVSETNLAQYLSANVVSFVGLLFAILAARMFYSPHYKYHLLGVFFFKIRDFMDSVDGEVASISKKESANVPRPDSYGYIFDGVCDGLAVVSVLVGLGFWMLRETANPSRHKIRYRQLLNIDIDDLDDKPTLPAPLLTPNPDGGIMSKIWGKILAFLKRLSGNQLQLLTPILSLMVANGIQVLISSIVWNYTIYHYYILFDTDEIAVTPSQQIAQNLMLKSPTTWIVIYMWRLLNPHTMMEYILISILYGKTMEYLQTFKWWGYTVLTVAGGITYLHYKYAIKIIMEA